MLVLSRRVGEEIIIDGGIRLQVIDVRAKRVVLGFTAPEEVVIIRHEAEWSRAGGRKAVSRESNFITR